MSKSMSIPVYLQQRELGPTRSGGLTDAIELYRPLLGTWLLELALLFDWHRNRRQSRRPDWPEIFEDEDFTGLTGLVGVTEGDQLDERRRSTAACKTIIMNQLALLRREELSPELPLFRNISLLSSIIGLTEADQTLLAFAAVITLFPPFRSAISSRNIRASHPLLCQLLAGITGLPEQEFRSAIGDKGLLITTGIVKVHRSVRDLEDKLDLMEGLASILLTSHTDKDELTARFLKRASPPTLSLENFPHLTADTGVLLSYLKNSLNEHAEGVNVLLHGKPGVGKTEYVQALAVELGVDLYEVDFSDENGEPITGESRLRAYSLCQNLLAQTSNSLLLFDEIEDVFPGGGSAFFRMLFGGKGGDDGAGKAWINRTMERNPAPALWVSNRVEQIDPAYLRRFDYSLQFPLPPLPVRLSIARHHLGCFTPPEGWLERIAADEELTPGQLDRAAKVARIAGKSDPHNAITLADQTLDRSALLLSQRRSPARTVVRTGYSLEYLNTDVDVEAVIAGLRRRPQGSFCFYGAAGTGKSELARHLADQVGKPFLIKRASDIMDKYVGETEKRLAGMFAEARQQDAILLLDEADSFLADRRDARQSWEMTQVNELLTQMEAFDGLFICTTNLMEKLDPASLRRFAFKVRFDPLTPEQRWSMFRQELARPGGAAVESEQWEQPVRNLDRLTPGDFAVAARQFELLESAVTPELLYGILRKECEAKGSTLKKIGF